MLEQEQKVMDDLFEANSTLAFNYMVGLIKQTKEEGDYGKSVEMFNALAQKIEEKRKEGKLVILGKADLVMAELMGFDTSFLRKSGAL